MLINLRTVYWDQLIWEQYIEIKSIRSELVLLLWVYLYGIEKKKESKISGNGKAGGQLNDFQYNFLISKIGYRR